MISATPTLSGYSVIWVTIARIALWYSASTSSILTGDFGGGLGVHAGKGVEGPLDHGEHPLAHLLEFSEMNRVLACFGKLQGAARDAAGLVADALEVAHRLDDGKHEPQVAGGGLAPGDNQAAFDVDFPLEAVDQQIVVDDPLGELAVVFRHRTQGVADVLFHLPPHAQHVGADFFQFMAELAGNMRSAVVPRSCHKNCPNRIFRLYIPQCGASPGW